MAWNGVEGGAGGHPAWAGGIHSDELAEVVSGTAGPSFEGEVGAAGVPATDTMLGGAGVTAVTWRSRSHPWSEG